MSQPFSLGRVLLILLPGLPEPPIPSPDGKRRRSAELEQPCGPPRLRAAHVTLVHSDSCCNVRVDLDAATDALTQADVDVLRGHGFQVALGSHFAHKTSVCLGDGIGDVRWPTFVPAKAPTLRDMIAPPPPTIAPDSTHATLHEAVGQAMKDAGPGGEVVIHVPEADRDEPTPVTGIQRPTSADLADLDAGRTR